MLLLVAQSFFSPLLSGMKMWDEGGWQRSSAVMLIRLLADDFYEKLVITWMLVVCVRLYFCDCMHVCVCECVCEASACHRAGWAVTFLIALAWPRPRSAHLANYCVSPVKRLKWIFRLHSSSIDVKSEVTDIVIIQCSTAGLSFSWYLVSSLSG